MQEMMMQAKEPEPFVPVPLVFDDALSVSSITRVLFINSAASSLQTYANASTFAIVYNDTSTLEEVLLLIRRKFPAKVLPRIGFAFHNNGDLTHFLNGETWFSDSDLAVSQTAFSQNAQFILNFIREFGVANVDFLACKTLQSEKWRMFFQLLRTQTGVVVGASENDTGNIKFGGDWILESTMEDIRDVYFTSAVENWASLLVATMTIVANVGHYNDSLTILGDFMYTFAGTKIIKIDLRTNTIVNANFYTSNHGLIRAMCAHENFLYFHSGNNSVGKLNISDGSVVSLNWLTGLNYPWGIVTDGTYLYISNYAPSGSATAGGRIVRVLLTFTGVVPAGFITGLVYPWHICIYENFLYTVQGPIRKYNLSTGALVTNNLTNSTISNSGVGIWAHNNYLYTSDVRFNNTVHGITQISIDGTVVNNTFFQKQETKSVDSTTSSYLHTNDFAVYNNKLYCVSYDYGYVFSIDGLPPLPVTTVAPVISARPTAAAAITYPATLGTLALTGGSALSAVGGTEVAGTFTIDSTISSSVYNAGTYIDVSATFNPTDTVAYSSVATSVPSITVSKATPYVASRPTSATIEYPKKMSSVVITGGACTVSNGGASLPGTFTIHPDLSNSVFAVGTYQDVSAIFTPTSNTNYGTVVTTIPTLTVTQVATSQLQSLGLPAADLKTAGYTAADLKTAGFTATQQKSAGFTASEQKAAGFTASEQKAAGFTATEQKAAGFTASELKAASFSTAELKTAAFTPTELKAAGVSNAELYATFTTSTETKSVTKAVVSEVLASTAKAPLPLSDLVGYSFASSVQSVLAVKVTEVNSPVAVTRSEIQNGITAIYAVLDVSGGYVILPTWSSSVRVMNIGNELYRVYDSTGNTILDNNLQTGTTRTYDGITVVIGSVTATLATPPSVNFVLNALNSSIQLSTSSVIPSYSQSFTADATITLNTSVPASVFQETFFFRTDTDITTDASFVYYYVDTTKWPNKNTTLSARNGIVTSNGYVASDTGAKDFLRDLARQLFGTYLGADLFTNEDAVVADINTKFDTVANNIVSLLNSIDKTSGSFSGITIDGSGNKYLKDDTSTSNISRELMNELITAAPARFADIKTYYKYNGAVEDGFYKIPILAGDTITFKITISPATNQTSAVPTGPSVLTSRSYTVVLNVT